MKKVWMIYPDKTLQTSNNAFDWFKEEALRIGLTLEILSMESFTVMSHPSRILYKNHYMLLPDIVIIRGYNHILSLAFEAQGIKVINSTLSMILSRNKMLTHLCLQKSGLPSPLTLQGRDINYYAASQLIGSNTFIIKGLCGSKGEQVWLISNEKEYNSILEQYKTDQILLQKYLQSSKGRDIRVWVIGGKAVACVKRYSDSDFRSNFSQGGSVQSYELTDEIKMLSEAAAKCLGLDFCGVDLLFTNNGHFTICEINGNAGFRTITKIGGENIPRLFLEFILHLS